VGRSGILRDRLRPVGATCACGLTILLGARGNVARADEPMSARVVVPVPSAISAPALVAESRAIVAPLAGALTLVVPFMVGSLLVARDDDRGLQNIGSTVMLAGFAVAPWVSHALAGRWGRGLAFGGAALAASAATWIVMAARDPYDPQLGNRKRLPFGFLISTSFFLGAGGVADSFIVGPEQRQP